VGSMSGHACDICLPVPECPMWILHHIFPLQIKAHILYRLGLGCKLHPPLSHIDNWSGDLFCISYSKARIVY